MLSFGYFAFIPFVYSLTARYLYLHPDNAVLNTYTLCAIIALEGSFLFFHLYYAASV